MKNYILIATLFLLACVGIGFYYRSRNQFDKLSKEDKIMHYMSKILTILRKRKYGIHIYETLKVYCERLKEEKLFSDSLFYEKKPIKTDQFRNRDLIPWSEA